MSSKGQLPQPSHRATVMQRLILGVLTLLPLGALQLAAADTPALTARLAARGLLLDITTADQRLVAVGAQGVIITSDDEGTTWLQSSVPVSSMLTCVSFLDARNGWAGGHLGVLLHTGDGGRTWSRTSAPTTEDDSFLDVLALPGGRILAAGAYGLYFVSRDGGSSWERSRVSDEDQHINRLTRGASGTIYLAAEAGTLAASPDGGDTWRSLESPYEGSFYGLQELTEGRLLAYGLRGHIFISPDRGASWDAVPFEHSGLLASAVEVPDGRIVFSGAGGQLFSLSHGTVDAKSAPSSGLKATAEMVIAHSGGLIAVGDGGVVAVAAPKP